MKLAALRLFNVKRFAARGVAIEGIGDGVNVLCAANEFGKSTSFEALHALFFQRHSSTAGDVRNLRPYSGGNPVVEVDIAADGARYRVTKQFYGGGFARVVDMETGRLIAQADEAENFIARVIRGGAGGPAGLLWVRQGITGIERRSRAEEESDKQVRADLLQSVQGEVEAVTGGRRMAEIMAATEDACAELVTATGRPKAGGRYAIAIAERDRLAADERRLADEVLALRDALDRRSAAQGRLSEIDAADERHTRRQAVEAAEAAFDAARTRNEMLKAVEAELGLARERRDAADRAYREFRDALEQAHGLAEESRMANHRRDEVVDRRRAAIEGIEQAQAEADAAEAEEQEARALLDRLEAAERARESADRHAELQERLRHAEEVRGTIENCEARHAQARLPAGAIRELEELDVEIARIGAVRQASRPSVTVAYENEDVPLLTIGGMALRDGEERGYEGHAQLIAPGIGTITLRASHGNEDDQLEAVEDRRRALLGAMGVADLAAARARQVLAQGLERQLGEARAQLAVLAPEGLAKLRELAASHAASDPAPIELKGDPAETRAQRDKAEQRRKQARETLRAIEPARANAETSFVAAETELATLRTRDQQIVAILGAADERDERIKELADRFERLDAELREAQARVDDMRAAAFDLDAAEAALKRVRSVEQAAETEIQQLRETIAALNALIRTRSDEAVEENWRETADALAAAQTRVAAFEQEVAVLQRLAHALETARSNARDLYLTPVMNELRPLLGLLFDDVSVAFDDRTLLPHRIVRQGLEEDVDRLSGGMREQLSILTRLAFARLLARDGHPAPVILDDALVYSDDDRIERMFDALHRQARDQQIIVFSCRQRAFQKLGGNVLQMTDWQPTEVAA